MRRWTSRRSCGGAPELCLIDELAHTNAPGTEHAKRYEDVEEILAAGIDVLSTLNVQHLESLNDRVTELTGVRVRETIPDAILGNADEVELIDLTPDALLDRLREGKVYPPERINTALNNFFRIENLTALREVALRQTAEEVGSKRLATEFVGSREESVAEVLRGQSASGCWRSWSHTPAHSALCAARGAPPSAWALSSTSFGCAPPASASPTRMSARLARCDSSPRCLVRGCSRRNPTTGSRRSSTSQ